MFACGMDKRPKLFRRRGGERERLEEDMFVPFNSRGNSVSKRKDKTVRCF